MVWKRVHVRRDCISHYWTHFLRWLVYFSNIEIEKLLRSSERNIFTKMCSANCNTPCNSLLHSDEEFGTIIINQVPKRFKNKSNQFVFFFFKFHQLAIFLNVKIHFSDIYYLNGNRCPLLIHYHNENSGVVFFNYFTRFS